ncbi:HAMP domain-containing histidine kinase [Mucilaginibacter sp. UR6-1]|uniref:sensor histidine kinase n=1 Tax=Mucilaginibacter sp. UR6-1 TaxID=1435643 RepID=UPI001E640057|nr:HAMP domain-containing sensor histidine kinase [Mucilaginibacter sp. UR6-1]MCC8407775.1 HAMP domain-containing histidine kinase [Mucilaginibacter sp. UR6-1]
MTISSLIKNNYPKVDAYQGVKQVKPIVSGYAGALVTVDGSEILGVITAYDLFKKQHNLIVDCLTEKPVLSPDYTISDALSVMRDTHSDILMVYEGETLLGVINKQDIIDHLCNFIEEQQNLIQSIAHDLKNPISNVLSVTYLLEHAGKNEENSELITIAQESCRYATEIINDMLVAESQNLLKARRLNLNELIRECIASFKTAVQQKKIKLKEYLPPEASYIQADQIKIKRAFSNLLSNAIKFTPSGGEVTVTLQKDDGHLLVIFKDNGIGIPAEKQSGIYHKFTAFRRTGTDGESSTGLGMYITRQIIESHEGKIWLESRELEGTIFYVRLSAVGDQE